jgi:hypothetical protein
VAVTLNPGNDTPRHQNYLTAQSSYDTDTEVLRDRHHRHDYEFDDSGGEYGDLCVDGHEQRNCNSYQWDVESQVRYMLSRCQSDEFRFGHRRDSLK